MNTEQLTLFETDKIPGRLKVHRQWINWKAVPKENGKVDKIPIDPRTLRPAKTNDRSTWTDFKTAVSSAKTNNLGLGFVFGARDGLVGVDLDDCFVDGKPEPWAQEVVDQLGSYSEITPSGKGLHIIAMGELTGKRRRIGPVETYQSGRFFTVTGERLNDVNYVLQNQDGINDFYRQHFGEEPEPEPVKPETAAIEHNEKQILDGLKTLVPFQKLFSGDMGAYPSQSEADLALCSMIARRTNDAQIIDGIFRQSALFREKWDQLRGAQTYGEITIGKALEGAPAIPTGTSSKSDTRPEGRIPFTQLAKPISEFMATKFPPLIDIISGGILPEKCVMLLAGEPEAGKSLLSMEIALHLALGKQLWGGEWLIPKPRKTIVFQVENPDTHAQQRMMKMVEGLRVSIADLNDNLIILPADVEYDIMESWCRQDIKDLVGMYDADVMVIDPLSSFHNGDENNNMDMKEVLNKIRSIGIASIVIHHYGKPQPGRGEEYRVRGASSIVGHVDTVVAMTRKKKADGEMFMLRFDKCRHGIKSRPILYERDDTFLSHITEEDAMITPRNVQDVLIELGGEVENKFALIKALKAGFDCCESTAKSAIKRAEEMQMIAYKQGKGKAKKVVVFRGSR